MQEFILVSASLSMLNKTISACVGDPDNTLTKELRDWGFLPFSSEKELPAIQVSVNVMGSTKVRYFRYMSDNGDYVVLAGVTWETGGSTIIPLYVGVGIRVHDWWTLIHQDDERVNKLLFNLHTHLVLKGLKNA